MSKLKNESIGIVCPIDYKNIVGGFAQRVRADINAIIDSGYDIEVLFPHHVVQLRQDLLSKPSLITYINIQGLGFLPERIRLFFDMCTQMFNPFFRSALIKQSGKYSMIFAHLPWSVAASFQALKNKIPIVYVAHNFEHGLVCQITRNPLIRKLVRYIENYACQKAVKILCVSEQDMKAFKSAYVIPQDKLVLVPNTVNVDFFSQTYSIYDKFVERNKLGIDPSSFVSLFIGRMSYTPNLDALKFILNEFVPAIMQQGTNVKVLVAGARIPRWCLKNENKIISFYSDVVDIRLLYSIADVFIVPLRFGGGTRIKILESFAAMIPVISTTKGAEGIECQDKHDILIVRNDAHDFLSKIKSLSENKKLRNKLIGNAHALVLKKYDIAMASNSLRELITQFR